MAIKDFAIQIVVGVKDTASGVLDALTGRVAQLGAAIATYFSGRALANYLGSAVSSAADLEQQMSILAQVSGSSAEELDRLKESAEAVAASPLPYTAAQAAEGQIELAKAGQSSADIIASLPSVMSLASAAQLGVAESAEITTRTLSTFGLEAEQTTRVTDVLVAGANATNTSVRGIADALSYVGPTARAFGYSIEETVATVGALANSGIDASRAGTALNSVMAQLSDPTSKASKALDAAGISTRRLEEVIGALGTKTPETEAAIIAFGLEAGPALRALVAQGSGALAGLTDQMRASQGEADAAALAITDNLNGAFQALGSIWQTIKTRIGEGLLEPVRAEVQRLTSDLSAWLSSGQLEQVRDAIVSAFQASTATVREFATQIDLGAAAKGIAEFAASASESLSRFSNNAAGIADGISRGIAGVQTIWLGFRQAVELGAAAIVGGLSLLAGAWASVVEGAESVGLASEQSALKARAAQETLAEAASAYKDASIKHWQEAQDAFSRMVDTTETGAERMTTAGAEAATGAKALADQAGLTADELYALGASASFAADGQGALTAASVETAAAAEEASEAHGRLTIATDATTDAVKNLDVATTDLAKTTIDALNEINRNVDKARTHWEVWEQSMDLRTLWEDNKISASEYLRGVDDILERHKELREENYKNYILTRDTADESERDAAARERGADAEERKAGAMISQTVDLGGQYESAYAQFGTDLGRVASSFGSALPSNAVGEFLRGYEQWLRDTGKLGGNKPAGSSSGGSSKIEPVRTVEVKISTPQGSSTVRVLEGDESALISALERAGAVNNYRY